MLNAVKYKFPSEPAVIPFGPEPAGTANSVIPPNGVMRPTLSAKYSVNHRFPSGPVVMSNKRAPAAKTPAPNSVTKPVVGLMRPILLPSPSVNHRLPSGPFVIISGWVPGASVATFVTTPPVVDLAITLESCSAIQRFPSGPAAIPQGLEQGSKPAVNSEFAKVVVMRPIPLRGQDPVPLLSVYQSAPSGPATTWNGSASAFVGGTFVSLTEPVIVTRPIFAVLYSVDHMLPSGPALIPFGPEFAVGIAYSVMGASGGNVGLTAMLETLWLETGGSPLRPAPAELLPLPPHAARASPAAANTMRRPGCNERRIKHSRGDKAAKNLWTALVPTLRLTQLLRWK